MHWKGITIFYLFITEMNIISLKNLMIRVYLLLYTIHENIYKYLNI